MPATLRKIPKETLINELGRLSSESLRRKFLTKHKALVRRDTVENLAQLVVQKVRISTQEALNLAEAAVLIAKRLRGKEALALGLRAKGNALYSAGDNRAAVEHHHQSFKLYESLGIWMEEYSIASTTPGGWPGWKSMSAISITVKIASRNLSRTTSAPIQV